MAAACLECRLGRPWTHSEGHTHLSVRGCAMRTRPSQSTMGAIGVPGSSGDAGVGGHGLWRVPTSECRLGRPWTHSKEHTHLLARGCAIQTRPSQSTMGASGVPGLSGGAGIVGNAVRAGATLASRKSFTYERDGAFPVAPLLFLPPILFPPYPACGDAESEYILSRLHSRSPLDNGSSGRPLADENMHIS